MEERYRLKRTKSASEIHRTGPVPPDEKSPSALKHGTYSATAVLPGEDRAAFNKLHRSLIVEHGPSGATEDDIVATMARLIWRKQNLATLVSAHRREVEEYNTHCSSSGYPFRTLSEELGIEELLDDRIDKCLKRLLLVRGLKSISGSSSSVPRRRIAGPAQAAA